jgi:hypothetical protein
MADQRFPTSYLILTRGQQAAGELFIGWTPGRWEAFEQILENSGKFGLIYANPDAKIYVLATLCGTPNAQEIMLECQSETTVHSQETAQMQSVPKAVSAAGNLVRLLTTHTPATK